ncbi:MAG TPA: biotin carboxylase N-terminal domain-containing protein [Nevskiaceae bacterium]|nr:biotin carboxylase N-terminal domain-containing protein [Nevskiaceae bacterium]
MFSKLLIANRGEIACRVIRTCRRMGIQTVAVYSDADADARYVRESDERVRIGPAPARSSYLNANAILEAAKRTGAQAIHPGYGFLSEQVDLIDACAAERITFIGPHRDAIARMGSKIESKHIARDAGVPCIAGYAGDDQSIERLGKEALVIGFPLLIKPSAGGGGKGMKRVDNEMQLPGCLRDARAEAMAAFGDDKVLLERYIVRPRHVEIQLLGDKHGNLVHLFERECSIQRNYQKVIEEAPANHLSDEIRGCLFKAAISLGRGIGYDSAGTVEFVLDADRDDEPYFLEMNTRLQVEHAVTELTTGVDLVEQQIRVAGGETLPFGQSDLRRDGWAIEARVNSEIPEEDYHASFGRVTAYREPQTSGVRVDSGIDAQCEITPHYDSMVAKVIGFGSSRDAALARLVGGLRQLRIEGIHTNQAFLIDLLECPAFGDVLTTRFLTDLFPDGYATPDALTLSLTAVAAAGWAAVTQHQYSNDLPLTNLAGFRLTTPAGLAASTCVHVVTGDGMDRLARVEWAGRSELRVKLPDGVLPIRVARCCQMDAALLVSRRTFHTRLSEDGIAVWSEGVQASFRMVPDVLHQPLSVRTEQSDGRLTAKLPGLVSEILVQVGQKVKTGEPVVVLEAMKLFHTLLSPADATVASIEVEAGATVTRGTVLLTLGKGH